MTRVAAYCRVSTDKSDQVHSFLSQKAFFTEYIKSRPDWVLAEIYADEGITGTSTSQRSGFLKMIDDAFQGKFDFIVTKEVSRFSRNILDAISYTRRLREAGVGVIFLNDGISTFDTDAELRLGIMATFAQEESRKTSERVRWGQQRKMEQGVVFGRSLLGYDVRKGKIYVEPAGAETVRQIYRMFLDSRMGVRAIASALSDSRIPTKNGGDTWLGATVLKILRNEKYCGDLVQKKTVTADYLTHKKLKNKSGNLIYIRDHHEPIISREEWEAAQLELRRRATFKAKAEPCGNKYPLSGKIACGTCGATYLCRTRKRKDGNAYRVWTGGRCSCPLKQKQFREDCLAQCIRYIINFYKTDQLIQSLTSITAKIIRNNPLGDASYKKELSQLERKKIKLIDAYLDGEVSREEYVFFKEQYENELLKLTVAVGSEKADRTLEVCQMIAALISGEDADDEFYLSLIEKIEVMSNCAVYIYLQNSSGRWLVEF